MSRIAIIGACLAAVTLVLMISPAGAAEEKPIRVLILSGQNNHDWKTTTPVLQKTLVDSGLFTADVTNEPQKMDAGLLANYGVIVSNWTNWPDVNKRVWSEATEKAFLDFVSKGKGVVMVHAASSAFYTWPQFQELVGSWWKLGQTGHGSIHKFPVTIVDKEHPVTAGLADFETTDELWHQLGTADKLTVLATAKSDKAKGGSGKDEPAVHVRKMGEGRCVNIVLGHDARAMQNEGFKILLLRGTQWAATGKVTIPAPAGAKGPAGANGPAGEKQLTGQESVAELLALAAGRNAKLACSAVEALRAKATVRNIRELAVLLSTLQAGGQRGGLEDAIVGLCQKVEDGDQRTRPLMQALPGASLGGRCSILRVLGRLGGPQATEAIRLHLNHFNPRVRAAVVGVMLSWPTKEFAPDVLKIAAQKDRPAAAAMAVRAYCRMMSGQEAYDPAKAVEVLQKAQGAAAGDEEKQALQAAIAAAGLAANYAMMAGVSSPDDLGDDGASQGEQAAVDGNPSTFWDEQDGAKLYVFQLDWARPVRVQTLRLMGWGQHQYAPKDFDIVCDDKIVKQVRDARYTANCLTVPFEPTSCRCMQLRITGYYGQSPAIRELEVYDAGQLPPPPRFNVAYQGEARSLLPLRDKPGSGGPGAAIDCDENTWWDQQDGQKLYRLQVMFQRPTGIAGLRITGLAQQDHSPKDFDVVCDDKVVKQVKDAQYKDNVLEVALPPMRCQAVEMKITGCHGGSPGIRELEILGATE